MVSLVCLSVVFLALGSFEWSAVSAARIKVHLSEQGVARLQEEIQGQLPAACLDYKLLCSSEISTLSYPPGFEHVRKPWNRPGVSVGRSEAASNGLNRVIGLEVPGLQGDTVRDVIETLEEGGCLAFLFGGGPRDQFLGAVPRDVDMDTNCNTQTLLNICEEEWGPENCRGSGTSPIFHIGNPTAVGEEDIDIAYWESFFFGPRTNLEFTTNSVAYYPELKVLIDLAFTGVRDTCNKKIRIPVRYADWPKWTDYKVFRFWKLRVKDYCAVDEKTQRFIVDEAKMRIIENPIKFQEFFCRKALPGEWDKTNRKCSMPQTLCEKVSAKKAKYYTAFEEDLGKFWATTLKPLLDELNICTETSLATEQENNYYYRYLLDQLRKQATYDNYQQLRWRE